MEIQLENDMETGVNRTSMGFYMRNLSESCSCTPATQTFSAKIC